MWCVRSLILLDVKITRCCASNYNCSRPEVPMGTNLDFAIQAGIKSFHD